jgi:hypothetical protein
VNAAAKKKIAGVAEELAALYRKHRGLDPGRVVSWAKANPKSALHSRFQWNDGKAAHAFRLWQARQLIVTVEVEYEDRKVRQVYVSPVQSRGRTGYAALADVMSDEDRRSAFVAQALAEYERVGAKYEDLAELAGVRDAVAAARKSSGKRTAA